MAQAVHPWIEFIRAKRLKIAPRVGQLMDFHPTWIQNDCLVDWNYRLMRKQHIRELILKPRQVKISTVVSALIVAACMCEDNLSAIIGNLNEDQQKKLWEQKYRTFVGRMMDEAGAEIDPKKLLENNSLDRIKFRETGSNIYNEIHNFDLGRGSTLQIAHLTEFPFWENAAPEAVLNELMCSIADGYPTCVFIESTAAKDGDWFETTFRKSWAAQQSKDSVPPYWSARFYRWYQNEEYETALTAKGRAILKDTLDDEEKFLLEQMPIHLKGHGSERSYLAKLAWRRGKLETQDAATFRKNYPATIDDAFRSKRISMFDHSALDWYSRQRRNPKEQCIITLDPLSKAPDLRNEADGPLHVWQRPSIGHEYVIACDVGNEGSMDRNRSYTAAVVIDKHRAEVVATWQQMINPWDFAEVAYALGRYYNFGELVVEKAAGGVTSIHRLVNELAYPNMYMYGKFRSDEDAYGFTTNVKTRPQIIDYLRRCVRHHIIDIPCTRTQREMENFKEDNNGKMKAPKGFTDDLVMSMAMGCWVAKNESWVPRTDSIAERLELSPEPPRGIVRVATGDELDRLARGLSLRGSEPSHYQKYVRGA